MAAARRAAATHPSPAGPPGGPARRLPAGRARPRTAVLAIPAVTRAAMRGGVPPVAATGLPGPERPEGPGRRRVAAPGTAAAARAALGTQAGLHGAVRAGLARTRRTLAIQAGPATATMTAGPALAHPRAVPADGMTARARRRVRT